MRKTHVHDAAKELHALVDAFHEHWLRGREQDKSDWPLKMPQSEWWDHFLMFVELKRSQP